jgi:hypothetical protein
MSAGEYEFVRRSGFGCAGFRLRHGNPGLTRYVDLLTARREPRVTAGSARSGREFRPRRPPEVPSRSLRGRCRHAAPADMAGGAGAQHGQPRSLQIARHPACPAGDPERMSAVAGDIFAAAAEPRHPALQARAEQGTRELAGALSGQLAAFRVQAFVALSETLPCFLAHAWLALLNHPKRRKCCVRRPR